MASFSEGDIKSATWDCDNVNSSSPNGVSFRFIKEFWDEIMIYMFEYHING